MFVSVQQTLWEYLYQNPMGVNIMIGYIAPSIPLYYTYAQLSHCVGAPTMQKTPTI